MDIGTFLLLAGAGMIGGICNAVAGGGTFFTFPALLAAGVPPVVANATSAVSIWGMRAVCSAIAANSGATAPRCGAACPWSVPVRWWAPHCWCSPEMHSSAVWCRG